jgi:ABC-type multidrug transport system ATPase subunit
MVECLDLSKKYGETVALTGFSLNISPAEVFGIIGPDGSGKTTFLRILATLILPDSGTASILGMDVVKDYVKIRKSIGYMPGRFSLYADLTVDENLQFYASVFGVKIRENYHLIESIFDPLVPFKKRRAGKLSGGMKQKLALACALIHEPGLLLLDEPTTGVDAVSRKEFWDHLKELKNRGMTILVSTPYMDEAQRCDRLALVQKGVIMDVGAPGEIRSRFKGNLYQVTCKEKYEALLYMRSIPEVTSVHAFGQSLHFTIAANSGLAEVSNKLRDKGFTGMEISTIEPGMEDCFMQKMT